MKKVKSMFGLSKYLNNLKKYIQLEEESVFASTKEECLEKLKSKSNSKKEIYFENNNLLESLKPYEENLLLSDTEYDELYSYALELYNNFKAKDLALAYRLHKILLKNAMIAKDKNKIVREIYYAGIIEFYICKSRNLFKEFHFLKIYDYLNDFDSLGFEEKQLFLRSYGNRILYYTNDDDVSKILSCGQEVVDFFTKVEKNYPELCESIYPMKLAVYRNMGTGLSSFRNTNRITQEDADMVLEASTKAFEMIQYNNKTSNPFDLDVHYKLMAAKFFAKKISIEELLQYLDSLSTLDEIDNTPDSFRKVFRYGSFYIGYYYLYGTHSKNDFEDKVKEKIQNALDYIKKNKKEGNSFISDKAILSFLESVGPKIHFEDLKNILFDITIFQHQSTFLHTKMVCSISDILIRELLKSNPEYFVGIINDFSLDMVCNNRDRIIDAMKVMSLFHDIGKHECITYVSNSSRRLMDIEFEIIKTHPVFGYELLKNNPDCPQEVLDGILYHHVFYNGQGGYPSISNNAYSNKPLVDILVVADSIDAATDYLGRPYAKKKELSEIKEELVAQSGTRYSPLVVEQLNKPEIFNKIYYLVNEGREELYYETNCSDRPKSF